MTLFQLHDEVDQAFVPEEPSSPEWSTPHSVFDPLHEEFGFTIDVCATAGNAKSPRFYTAEQDGLAQLWNGETVWMNPPYSRNVIDRWMRKAWTSAALYKGTTVVCLVPSSTSSAWWHDYAMRGEIRFVRGRIRFGGSSDNAAFSSSIIIFRPGGTK